jgi:hypothetical protein
MRRRGAIRVEDEIGSFPGKLDGQRPVSPRKWWAKRALNGFSKTKPIGRNILEDRKIGDIKPSQARSTRRTQLTDPRPEKLEPNPGAKRERSCFDPL